MLLRESYQITIDALVTFVADVPTNNTYYEETFA